MNNYTQSPATSAGNLPETTGFVTNNAANSFSPNAGMRFIASNNPFATLRTRLIAPLLLLLALFGADFTARAADTTKPTMPSNPTITIGTRTENSIAISWDKATDNQTTQANLQYEVRYSKTSPMSWTVKTKVKNITSATVTGLTANTSYYFTVHVYDEAGNYSVYSTATATTNPVDTENPDIPNKTLTLTKISDVLRIGFAQAHDDVTTDASLRYGFQIFNAGTNQVTVAAGPYAYPSTGYLECSKSELTADQIANGCDIRVHVTDEAGKRSYYTKTRLNDWKAPTVSNPTITVGTVTSSSVALSWAKATDESTASANLRYYLHYWLNGYEQSISLGTDKSSYTRTGLAAGTAYTFNIRVIDNEGNYADYTSITVTTGTAVTAPTLSAVTITAITTTSATFSCTVTNNGGASITKAEFAYGKSGSSPLPNTKTATISGNTFTATITGLSPNTKYAVEGYALNSGYPSAGSSGEKTFTTTSAISAPTVETVKADNITQTTATLYGKVSNNGGAPVTAYSFQYRRKSTESVMRPNASGTDAEFSCVITNLTPDTEYEYRAVAQNSAGGSPGEWKEFRTAAAPTIAVPSVTTVKADNITTTAAIIYGSVSSNGGDAVTAYTCQYRAKGTSTVYSGYTTGTDASFSCSLTGLTAGTDYEYRMGAVNSKGTGYGGWKEFKTAATTVAVPTVVTVKADNITRTSATLHGSVSNNGGSAVTLRGFGWRKKGGEVGGEEIAAGTDAGFSFTIPEGSLTPDTEYEFCAVAENSAGQGFGEWKPFKTASPTVTVPVVVTVKADNITATSATLYGSVGSDGGAAVTRYDGVYRRLSGGSIYGFTPTGTDASFSYNLTGLEPDTEYEFRMTATNSKGMGMGEFMKFKTAVATVTVAVTGVTVSPTTKTLTVGETATLSATVSPSTATNKSVSWSSSDGAVASVGSSGVVTAKATGSCRITATTAEGGFTASCDVTVSAVPDTRSGDNSLASLSVDGVTLSPAFSPSINDYTAQVGHSTASLTVHAAAGHPKATVAISGATGLKTGDNTVTVAVTAENGDVRTYRIVVTRDTATAVETVASRNAVWSSFGTLHIRLPQPAKVSINSLSGTLVRHTLQPAGETSFPLPQGIYIVRVGGEVRKVVIP